MSKAEILAEGPTLSVGERDEIRRRLAELDEENADAVASARAEELVAGSVQPRTQAEVFRNARAALFGDPLAHARGYGAGARFECWVGRNPPLLRTESTRWRSRLRGVGSRLRGWRSRLRGWGLRFIGSGERQRAEIRRAD